MLFSAAHTFKAYIKEYHTHPGKSYHWKENTPHFSNNTIPELNENIGGSGNLHLHSPLLAIRKCDTGDWLLSKAINDNKVSDDEFQITSTESTQYNSSQRSSQSKTDSPAISSICG